MGQAQRRAPQSATVVEGYREGSRWVSAKPSGEELASWFTENVKLHEGLEHRNYVQGIVLISQKEKVREVSDSGAIVERERLTYTPYPTTSARLAYFRDWLVTLEGEVLWEIAADESTPRGDHGLPAGFFRYVVKRFNDQGKEIAQNFIGCSMVARVYQRDIRAGGKGRALMLPPAGSKVVATVGRYGADENAVMKAQTGAIGRALGFAGMLVIPGTGVATAEDVQEAVGSGGEAAVQPELPQDPPDAPPDKPEPTDLRAHAAELIGALQEYPAKLEEVHELAKERKWKLDELKDPQVRGVVRLLEKKLEEARAE